MFKTFFSQWHNQKHSRISHIPMMTYVTDGVPHIMANLIFDPGKSRTFFWAVPELFLCFICWRLTCTYVWFLCCLLILFLIFLVRYLWFPIWWSRICTYRVMWLGREVLYLNCFLLCVPGKRELKASQKFALEIGPVPWRNPGIFSVLVWEPWANFHLMLVCSLDKSCVHVPIIRSRKTKLAIQETYSNF